MLSDKNATATVAVKDLEQAKEFYESKLGLMPAKTEEGGGGVSYKTGSTELFVYQSSFAGTNQATTATFGVGDDLEKIVEDLKGKDIEFEHYEGMPNVTIEGDIHVMGEMRTAWFKDPDGNILNLNNKA